MPTWPLIGYHWTCFAKPLMIHRRQPTQQCSEQPQPGKWLLPLITSTSSATCTCPMTTDSHSWSSAKHPWNMPQNPCHDNKIWKSWHWRCSCSPWLCFPGPCATRPHYACMGYFSGWWVRWGWNVIMRCLSLSVTCVISAMCVGGRVAGFKWMGWPWSCWNCSL